MLINCIKGEKYEKIFWPILMVTVYENVIIKKMAVLFWK